MNFKTIWKNYQVVVVTIPIVLMVHFTWYKIKDNPIFNPSIASPFDPEPDVVSHVETRKTK
uniref:Uncharacterized protein n=1 Tax=Pogona vitticeps TaxID=103695 RepID=A0ABM5GP10_9SAUR